VDVRLSHLNKPVSQSVSQSRRRSLSVDKISRWAEEWFTWNVCCTEASYLLYSSFLLMWQLRLC